MPWKNVELVEMFPGTSQEIALVLRWRLYILEMRLEDSLVSNRENGRTKTIQTNFSDN